MTDGSTGADNRVPLYKSSFFQTFLAVMSAVVIPVGLLANWVDGDMSDLKAEIKELKSAVETAGGHASTAASNSEELTRRISDLVTSMARSSAQRNPDAVMVVFQHALPSDVFDVMAVSVSMGHFEYSDFDNRDWLFIAREKYNLIHSDIQAKVEKSLIRTDVTLIVD